MLLYLSSCPAPDQFQSRGQPSHLNRLTSTPVIERFLLLFLALVCQRQIFYVDLRVDICPHYCDFSRNSLVQQSKMSKDILCKLYNCAL